MGFERVSINMIDRSSPEIFAIYDTPLGRPVG